MVQRFQSILGSFVILLFLSGVLWYLDYEGNHGRGVPTFVTRILEAIPSSPTITEELLKETSLIGKAIKPGGTAQTLFPSYLPLPDGRSAQQYEIDDTTIHITEVRTRAMEMEELIRQLRSQSSTKYRFRHVNQQTFYLQPLPQRIGNENNLAMVLNGILYGFRYEPLEHGRVLEIIDALKERN